MFLELTNDGTNQVKEFKISNLTHKYELFKMKSDDSISSMHNCFNDIIVGLEGLGKKMSNVKLNRKLLQALLKEWRPKVTAIEEA